MARAGARDRTVTVPSRCRPTAAASSATDRGDRAASRPRRGLPPSSVVSSGARASTAHVLVASLRRRARAVRRRLARRRHRRAAVHAALGAQLGLRRPGGPRRSWRRARLATRRHRRRDPPAARRRSVRRAFEPSPYLPVSRLFWHERWLDVDAVASRTSTPRPATLARARRRGRRRAALAAHPYVDGEGVDRCEARRPRRDGGRAAAPSGAPERVVLGHVPRRAARGRGLRAVPRGGRAIRAGLAAAGRSDCATAGSSSTATWTGAVVDYHALRPVARRRAAAAPWPSDFAQRGQVLSLDLPLGVHPDGYDVWRHRDNFAPRASRSARRPTASSPGGRSGASRRRASTPRDVTATSLFRAALVHHLNVAGMLRIDHVLGTQRLFCVPDGMAGARRRVRAHAARGAPRRRRHRGAAPPAPRSSARTSARSTPPCATCHAARRDPPHARCPAVDQGHRRRAVRRRRPPERSPRSRPTTCRRSRAGGAVATSTSASSSARSTPRPVTRCARERDSERSPPGRARSATSTEHAAIRGEAPPSGLLAAAHGALARERARAWSWSSSTTCSASSRR